MVVALTTLQPFLTTLLPDNMTRRDSDAPNQSKRVDAGRRPSLEEPNSDPPHSVDDPRALNSESRQNETVRQSEFAQQGTANRSRDSLRFGSPNEQDIVIGRYRLVRKIAEGGMGAVFEAEQTKPVRRRVALKLVRDGLNTRSISLRFEAERQALAMMDHPSIAKILDAGTCEHDQPYFVMDLIDGSPLTDYCDQNQLSLESRLELFATVCDAVQHAHQKGIIHRDLKPSNILVSDIDGVPTPKIIDFGLAKALDATSRLTDDSMMTGYGQILGTLKYMSPEQAGSELNDIDTRSDIYALGVILYELLTGSTPVDSESLRDQSMVRVLEIIRVEEAPRPSQRLSSTDHDQVTTVAANRQVDLKRLQTALIGDLDWIVMKSLEKERERRFQSASAFGEDIRRYLNDEPVLSRPPSRIYQVRKFVRKNRLTVSAGTAVLLALLFGFALSSIGFVRARSAETLAGERYLAEQDSRKEAELQRELADEKRETAERNLAFAQESNEVLFNVFAELDPDADFATVGELRTALANQLLTASHSLTRSKLSSPVVEANLRMRLGISLIGLGMYDHAKPLLLEALDIHTKNRGPYDRQTLLCKSNLAALSMYSNDLSASLEHRKDLLAQCREHLGESDELTIECLHGLGQIQRVLGQFESALANIDEAISRLSDSHDDSSRKMVSIRYSRVALLRQMGQAEMAISELTKLKPLVIEAFGETDPTTMEIRNSLAVANSEVGNHESAKSMLEECLADVNELLGRGHPQAIAVLFNLALAHQGLGEFEKAFEYASQAATNAEQHFGPKHAETIRIKQVLAGAYEDIGNRDAALKMYPELITLMAQSYGLDHPRTLETMNNYAYALQFKGRISESVEWYEKAIAGAKRKFTLEHPMTLTIMDGLGRTHLMADRPELAVKTYSEALTGWQEIAPPRHSGYLLARLNLSESLKQADRHDEAIQVLRATLSDLEQVLEATDPDLLEVVRRLAMVLDEAFRAEEASELYLRVADGFLDSAPEHPYAKTAVASAIDFFERTGDQTTAKRLTDHWRANQKPSEENRREAEPESY